MKKRVILASALSALLLSTAILPHISAGAAPATYSDYVNVSENVAEGKGLFIEPTLVLEATSFEGITSAAKGKQKPASVIITPDEEMNVTLGGEKKSLKETFDSYIKGKLIPIVRLNAATVSPFVAWLKNTYTIADMMAVSSDITVLEQLYADETAYLVNTVYDLTDVTIGAGRYDEWDHIGAANKAGCNILLYDGGQQNLPVAAEYVEAMAKVCWATVEDKESAVNAMAAGCYGVVCNEVTPMTDALKVFEKSGFARAQYIAAHRGITAYCNEQSKTAIAATANEGATHIELDLQITSDQEIFICHNSNTSPTAKNDINAYFSLAKAADIKRMHLSDYSGKYADTFPTLDEAIRILLKTDVIFIFELKFDAASSLAGDADKLDAIGTMKKIIEKYPEMKGRWIAITFYSLYAERMREVCPEIPVGFLGSATSAKYNEKVGYPQFWGGNYVTRGDLAGCMKKICRKFNVSLDEMTYDNANNTMDPTTNRLAPSWLARGYAQNTWTFEDPRHFGIKCNIATTNAAEDCALLVKTIGTPESLTEAALASGKVTLPCKTYNGWKVEKECEIIVVSREGNKAKVLFYLEQTTDGNTATTFGLYSNLAEVTIG